MMVECENFMCGHCHIAQYPGMFGEEHPPDSEGIPWAGPIEGEEESMSCTKKDVCREYKPMEPDDNGKKTKKKKLPKITDINRDAFLYVALQIIENLTHKQAVIAIKQEALDTFPDIDKPVFAWNNSKEQWIVTLPVPDKPKIATPNRRIIGA